MRATEFPKLQCATMSAIFAAILKCFSLGAIDFAGGDFIILSHALTSPSQFPDLIYLYILESILH